MGCARFVCRAWEGKRLSFSPWMRILKPLLLSSDSTLAVFSLHVMHWGGFHGPKDGWQGWPAFVGLRSRSPTGQMFPPWLVSRTDAV